VRRLTILCALASALAPSGCYEHHFAPLGVASERDAGVDAGRDARDAGSIVRAEDAGEDEGGVLCEEQCSACADEWAVSSESCVEGCLLRFGVAKEGGCASDFSPWIDCIAESCDYTRCLERRTCW
jgi:hypothetical protein